MTVGCIERDDEFIRQNFAAKTDRWLSNYLGRTIHEIRKRRRILGLQKQTLMRWTDNEDKAIREAYEYAKNAPYMEQVLVPLAQRLGRRYSEVSFRAKKLGLSFKSAKVRQTHHRGRPLASSQNVGHHRYEHQVIAERMIGRKLFRNETVHHINCDKNDNRPENLIVCDRGKHRRLHLQLEEIARLMLKSGEVEFDAATQTYQRVTHIVLGDKS